MDHVSSAKYSNHDLIFASAENLRAPREVARNKPITWLSEKSTLVDQPIWNSQFVGSSPGTIFLDTHYLSDVESGQRRVRFDRGLHLAVTVVLDSELYVASDEKFGIYGSGRTVDEAIADYSDFFVEFFSEIVNTPNAELPPSAQSLKRTFKAFGKLENSG